MLPYTSAPLSESGGRSKQLYPSLGEHITPTRNIKQNTGWLWQEKQALKLVGQSFSGDRLRAARSIYLALTEIASNQFTPDRAHTSCAYLGTLAGLGENAVRRYLHEFERLGLIRVEVGIHRANTYILLAVASNESSAIASAEMKLADRTGVSHAPAPDASYTYNAPATPRQRHSGTPAVARATRHSTQDSRILQNNKESTTNNGAAVASDAISPSANSMVAVTPMLRIAEGVSSSHEVATTSAPPTPPSPAAAALASLGVRQAVAGRIAAAHDEQQIIGWVSYARTAPNLKSRAGFVLTMLQQNQEPPSAVGPLSRGSWMNSSYSSHSLSFAQPEPAQGLTEATVRECDPPIAPIEELPPPSASAQAVWHTVKEELLSRANATTRMWLQHIRLLAADAARVVLSSPPLGGPRPAGDTVREDIAALLGTMLGSGVQVEFQAGW